MPLGLAKICSWLSLAALAASPLPAAYAEPKLELRPRFVAGQENKFVVEMRSRTSTQLVDKPRIFLQDYDQRVRVKRKVVAADAQGATIEVMYESVAVTLVAGNKSITFDSDTINSAEADDLVGPTARNALNKPFTVKVDPLGKVLSVSGNEQDGTKLAAINLIGTDILTESLGPIYGPGKEQATVTPGEVWSATRTTPAGMTGSFIISTESKLSSMSGPQAIIDLTGSVKLDPSEKARQSQAELTTSTIVGQRVWNAIDGIIDRAVYRQEMTIFAQVEVQNIAEQTPEIKRRRADTMLFIDIERADDAVPALAPVPASLRPTEIPQPEAPPPAPTPAPADKPADPAAPATPAKD